MIRTSPFSDLQLRLQNALVCIYCGPTDNWRRVDPFRTGEGTLNTALGGVHSPWALQRLVVDAVDAGVLGPLGLADWQSWIPRVLVRVDHEALGSGDLDPSRI